MLEYATLLLEPWVPMVRQSGRRPGSTAAIRMRAILAGDSGQPLGVVYRTVSISWWRRWLTWPRLEVYETQDESLLCTIYRFWGFGPAWEVRDADEHRVARLSRIRIEDLHGRDLAWVERNAAGSPLRWVSLDGTEVGTLTCSSPRTMLTFAAGTEKNPFLRMALLAAAICTDRA